MNERWTWEEVQIIALQKMFLINSDVLEVTDSTKPYLAAMPGACNEALSLLKGCKNYLKLYDPDHAEARHHLKPTGLREGEYYLWPQKITKETPNEYELPIHGDLAVLIPLYIASELYKDDDNSIATMYRNEFEAGMSRLQTTETFHWTSKKGW